jgi:hypothetical protein
MALGPCLNPSCRSHGQPHPNCKCYSFAEGGSVDSHYCASNRPHKASCEYFAEGGVVAEQQSPSEGAIAAISQMGAHGLFGSDKSPFLGAFGSKKGIGEDDGHLARYTSKISRGSKAIKAGVGQLFGGPKADLEHAPEDEKQAIRDYVDKGGIDKEISDRQAQTKPEDPLATLFPEHNLLLNASKARVAGYLNSVKPQAGQQLPFDREHSKTSQERAYEHAVGIAGRPLTILEKMRQGRLVPDDLKHLNGMYPELKDHLGKKMTEEITKAQLEGRKPTYRARQAMSLYLGAHLDSSFTPQSIQAAQATFALTNAQKQPPPQQGKNKKGTSTLTKASEQYETKDQAAETRRKQ